MRTGYAVASIVVVIVATSSVMSVAGPLDPPPGPVAPTYKTLTEVQPRIAISQANTPGDADSLYRISQPGSYYLTGNVQGVSGKSGIEVAASNVVIDLNGFTMLGVAGASAAIIAPSAVERVTVRNGTIDLWSQTGINLFLTTSSLIERVDVSRSVTGLAGGFRAVVRSCRATSNGFDGISVGSLSVVEDCQAISNTTVGIRGDVSVSVARCVASGNGSGVLLSSSGSARDLVLQGNTSAGLTLGDGGTAESCTAYGNQGEGFVATAQATFTRCTAHQNGISAGKSGFVAGERSSFTDCVATLNGQHGFAGSDSVAVRGCTASNNTERGISVNNGGKVVGNLTRNNQQDGIAVNFSCDVRDNNCNGDGAAAGAHGGLRVLGQANRIEANNVTFADRGLLIDQGGNIIVCNTARGCTVNFAIAGGNTDAQVLTPGAGFTASNPWANFSY